MIRETLGDEAIIVATGDERARGGVRVTAAIEPAFEIGDDGIAGSDSWLQYDDEQDTDAVAEELTEIMLRHGVPEDILDHVISCATVMGYNDISTALIETLEQLFSYRPLPTTPYKKAIMLVGPPGGGKTLAAAKIATRGTMNGLRVGMMSTDTVRAGGIEQLKAFTNLLGTQLHTTNDPKDLRFMAQDLLQENDQLIIDTAGLNPFNTDDIKILARLMSAVQVRPVLVMPAGMDCDEAGEMARVFATIGTMEMMPTRVDIARRYGSLLSAAHQGGLCFADMSDTAKVAHGLTTMTPQSLAKLFMPRLFRGIQDPQKNDIVSGYQSGTLARQKTGTS